MRDMILLRLAENGDLPALPEIVITLTDMLHDPQANARAIAKIIETDAVLAGKILRLSNSVYYSRSTTPIKTLPIAITKIGLNVLIKLVYSLKISTLFTADGKLDSISFWRHSFSTAILAQSLCKKKNADSSMQDIAYLSGLMHDVGVLVFGYLIPEEYTSFLHRLTATNATLSDQEIAVFGIDHAELGALFIRRWWKMDDFVTTSVRYHHIPFNSPDEYRISSQLLHASNCVLNDCNHTNGVSVYHEPFREEWWGQLSISQQQIENIIEDADSSFEQAKELLLPVS